MNHVLDKPRILWMYIIMYLIGTCN